MKYINKIKVDGAIRNSNVTALSGTNKLTDILSLTEMDDTTAVRFKQKVLGYCKENLVKLVVYLPSPYVTKLVVTEVNLGILSN